MHPLVQSCPPIPYQYVNSNHLFYDLIYKPETTLFLQNARERGAAVKNGMDMLVYQAEENWRIWNQ
jgi:shikimate dehydrogenase